MTDEVTDAEAAVVAMALQYPDDFSNPITGGMAAMSENLWTAVITGSTDVVAEFRQMMQPVLDPPKPPSFILRFLKRFKWFNKVARVFNKVTGIFGVRWEERPNQPNSPTSPGRTFMRLYRMSERNQDAFYEKIRRYIPGIEEFYPPPDPRSLHRFQRLILEVYSMLGRTTQWLSEHELKTIRVEWSFHDKNNLARSKNSQMTVSTMALEPLYRADGELVTNFPKTGTEIGKLNGWEINNLLVEVGLPTDGTLSDRKKRIMNYSGFTMLLEY